MEPTVASSDFSQAASLFKDSASEAPDPQLMMLCAQSLFEMAENMHAYIADLTVSTVFFEELRTSVWSVCQEKDASPVAMHDKAFGIMECLAVLSRESTLREENRSALPVQKDLMRYFEGCGHWTPGDGTLVTEYYYSRIPKASTDKRQPPHNGV